MTEEVEAPEAIENDVAPEIEADEQQQPEAEAQEPEAEEPAPKAKKSAQERISEITAARREAEREAAYWRKVALDSQQAPQQRPAQEQPRDAAPHPDDFTHGDADPNYLVALAKYEAKREIREEYEAREQAQRLQSSRSTFEQKVAEQFPDGEPEGLAALRSLPAIRSEITDVLFTSDKGPLIADHLGDNPSVLRRLEGLPAHLVGFELAKIEAALSKPAAPPVNRVTNAPSPAPKPRGAGGQFQVAPDTNDFEAFERFADKVRPS